MQPTGFAVAHLTAAGSFAGLNSDQRKELKSYVEAGGQILFDVAGGDRTVSPAMEDELRKTFPEQASQLDAPLTAEDPLFAADSKGDKLTPKYRIYSKKLVGNLSVFNLRGIKINVVMGRNAGWLTAAAGLA